MIENSVANTREEDALRPQIRVYEGCRPYVEVSIADPARREAWFVGVREVGLPSLNPKLLIGWIVLTAILLKASPMLGVVVGLAGAGYVAFTVSKRNKVQAANALGIEATARSVMESERIDAGQEAAFEMVPERLNIDAQEWREAREDGHVLFSLQAPSESVLYVERFPIAPRVTIRIAGVIARGVVDFSVPFDAIDALLDPKESEYRTIPWDSISMVSNSSSVLSVESMGGTQMRLYVGKDNKAAEKAGIIVLGGAHGDPDRFCRSIDARIHSRS